MAGLLLPDRLLSRLDAVTNPHRKYRLLGRVQQDGYPLYQAPTAGSDIIQEMAMDSVYNITKVTICDDKASTNRIWYELDGQGYAHSRQIQPVRMKFNAPAKIIPETGCLGEVSIPYVDAYSSMDAHRKLVYRFYYESTFWVTERMVAEDGTVWYQLLDDRNYAKWYVPAYYVRLVPKTELTAISPEIPYEEKKLVVDLNQQSLTAYVGEKIVSIMRISSGIRMKEGGFTTPQGFYRTTRKRPCRHMYTPPSEHGSGFDLPGVPWVSYFTSDGVAFHGTYWHNDFGVPHSHGCINMTPQTAKWIYRWTTPSVPSDQYFYADDHGTRVVIQ
jgi:hypothetical protein